MTETEHPFDVEPELLPCPVCNGEAEFEDGIGCDLVLRVRHHQGCSMCMNSYSIEWTARYHDDDFDPVMGTVRQQVARWWNRRQVLECEYEMVSNMKIGSVALDCFGLRCSNCGRQQMNMVPPNFCPDCGFRVRVYGHEA